MTVKEYSIKEIETSMPLQERIEFMNRLLPNWEIFHISETPYKILFYVRCIETSNILKEKKTK